MAITKRFLAGVTCPKCGLLDKTVLHRHDQHEHTECVRCGLTQQRPEAPIRPASTTPEQVITLVRPAQKKNDNPSAFQ